MGILAFNTVWMLWNIFLALVGVFFGWLMIRSTSTRVKMLFGFFWLLFVPNAIYIVTDIIHIPTQFSKIDSLLIIPLFLQYLILEISGIVTFVISIYFFEITLCLKRFRLSKLLVIFIIIVTNFIIGFGVVVGRVQRTNSWDVFLNPGRVIDDAYNIVINPNLFIFTIAMGIISNIVYFSLKNTVIHKVKPWILGKRKK